MEKVSNSYLTSVLQHIYTGTHADPVIAVLLLLCFFLFVILSGVLYYTYKKEKRNTTVQASYQKQISEEREKLEELATRYIDYSKYVNEQAGKESQEVLKAYNSILVALVEVKTLLNALVIFKKKGEDDA